ncbi:hypothetical protein DA102_035530 [Sinorhizobium meliloti]|nr:hypothetical protein DA102_035530 [Sinorhizobium meliloti]
MSNTPNDTAFAGLPKQSAIFRSGRLCPIFAATALALVSISQSPAASYDRMVKINSVQPEQLRIIKPPAGPH